MQRRRAICIYMAGFPWYIAWIYDFGMQEIGLKALYIYGLVLLIPFLLIREPGNFQYFKIAQWREASHFSGASLGFLVVFPET